MSIAWRPFLLRPNTPLEGTPKAPDTPDNPRVGARMKQAGATVGIDFTGKCDRAPNSVGAHTLIKFLEGKPGQNQLAEILFRQVSVTAKDPGLNPTPNQPPRPTTHGPRPTTHDPRPSTSQTASTPTTRTCALRPKSYWREKTRLTWTWTRRWRSWSLQTSAR